MLRALTAILRRLFPPAAILSTLLLALFLYSLWGFTYRRFDTRAVLTPSENPGQPARVTYHNSQINIVLNPGELWVTTEGTYNPPGFHARPILSAPSSPAQIQWWPYDGQLFRDYFAPYWSLRLPLWLPLAPVLLLSLLAAPSWLAHRRRKRRVRRGLCAGCAYDRAGLSDPAAPCPECGTSPTPARPRDHHRRTALPA